MKIDFGVFVFYLLYSTAFSLVASLLYRNGLLNTLGIPVGLVYLGELGKSIALQVGPVVIISNILFNGTYDSLEALVDRGLNSSYLASSLGGSLGVKNSRVGISRSNAYSLRVGNSRLLVRGEGAEVSLLNGEAHGSGTLGSPIDLSEERVVVLNNLPDELIRNSNHFYRIYEIIK